MDNISNAWDLSGVQGGEGGEGVECYGILLTLVGEGGEGMETLLEPGMQMIGFRY